MSEATKILMDVAEEIHARTLKLEVEKLAELTNEIDDLTKEYNTVRRVAQSLCKHIHTHKIPPASATGGSRSLVTCNLCNAALHYE